MSAAIDGSPVQETFAEFFDCWLHEQNQHLQSLVTTAREYGNRTDEFEDRTLPSLVNRVLQHYECYYQEKKRWVMEDVLAMMSPSWLSTLEDSVLWIAGWRPTMAFHLLYSRTGLQVEPQLNELIQGLEVSDLGGLSATQMTRVDEMHRKTTRKERKIDEEFAKYQESVADTSMVELSNLVSEAMMSTGETSRIKEDRVETTLLSKEDALAKIILKADTFRLETLRAVVGILTPIQAVHFLIAAAELHLRLHDWGKKRDHDKSQPDNSSGTNQPC